MLKEKFPITPATLSHHLKELSSAGLIEIRRNSKFMYVQLRKKTWDQYLNELHSLSE